MMGKIFIRLMIVCGLVLCSNTSVFASIVSREYVDTIVAALGTAANKNVGEKNGVATLDANAKIPASQIPIGTTANTVAAGNDTRIVNAVRTSGTFTMAGTYTITGTLNVATPPLPEVK